MKDLFWHEGRGWCLTGHEHMQNLEGNSLFNLLNWELKLELLKSCSCSEVTHQKKAEKTKSQANEAKENKRHLYLSE